MVLLHEARVQRMPAWVEAMLLLSIVIGQRRGDIGAVRFDQVITGEDGKQYLRIEQQKKAGKEVGARVEIPLDLRMDAIEMSVGEVIEFCKGCGKPGPTMVRKKGGGKLELSSLSARFHELSSRWRGRAPTRSTSGRACTRSARSARARTWSRACRRRWSKHCWGTPTWR